MNIKSEQSKKNARLPAVRISSELMTKIKLAIDSFNASQSGFIMTFSTFQRQALEHYSQVLLTEGFTVTFRPQRFKGS